MLSFPFARIQSPRGAQPNGGEMTWEVDRRTRLPGYEDVATIVITFSFPSGKQEVRLYPSNSLNFTLVDCYLFVDVNSQCEVVIADLVSYVV